MHKQTASNTLTRKTSRKRVRVNILYTLYCTCKVENQLVLAFAATLASIHSEAENWFFWEKMSEADPDARGRNFWVGMRKADGVVGDEEGV